MRPIAPRVGAPEVTYAEDQPEYMPVTVAIVPAEGGARYLLTRWTFTEDERRRIAAGEDLAIAQLNFGAPMTPLSVSLMRAWQTQEASGG